MPAIATTLFNLPHLHGEFIPATSKLEAVNRIAQLTGSPELGLGPGSKERRDTLVDLAVGLAVDVDLSATKPALAEETVRKLGGSWDSRCHSTGDTITLRGLNRLLEAADSELQRRAAGSAATTVAVPARSKIEAVKRIAALTGAHDEGLGPGSKERKSVLTNLVTNLELPLSLTLSKTDLGEAIATRLGGHWDSSCWSSGETITLEGLNQVLLAASAYLHEERRFATPRAEASALAQVLASRLGPALDGRTCIEQMRSAESAHWAQDEWLGFYFEFVGLPALVGQFSGGPVKFHNTVFDYSLDSVWDLKAHGGTTNNGKSSPSAPLNDVRACEACLHSGQGLGFLVLTGEFSYDSGEFRQWQREVRLAHGKAPARRKHEARAQRASKPAFTPTSVQAFHLQDMDVLNRALSAKAFSVMRQGTQASGAPRPTKYSIHLPRAEDVGLLLAEEPVSLAVET